MGVEEVGRQGRPGRGHMEREHTGRQGVSEGASCWLCGDRGLCLVGDAVSYHTVP